MADVKISALPSGTANASAVVPATNAAGTTTEKITLGAIAALGGGPPASHTHGNITNAGAIGSTSGYVVVTTTSGVLTAAATISATTQVSGLATVATSGAYSDLSGTPAAYTLPTASGSVLGGVKVGSGLSIDGSSVLSATYSYTLPNATNSTLGGVIVGTGLGVSSGTVSVTYGTSSGTACQGNDSRLSDARTPTSHTHGNISNAGAIGSTANLPVITTTSGVLTTGSFGTGSNTFCQGNDSRLSDSRTPTTHASTHQTGGADFVANVVNSPTQISADQNDYSLPSADIVRLDASAAKNITGFAAGTSGQAALLINVGSYDITIKHQSTSSSANNRVVVPWAGDCVLAANGGAATLVYDATSSRWRVI